VVAPAERLADLDELQASSSRHRYMATWRGTVSVFVRVFDWSPSGVTRHSALTACWMT
jgi:hypothetical protein